MKKFFNAVVVFAALTTLVATLPVAAANTNTSAIAGTWYGNMNFSISNNVQRIAVTIEDCTTGSVCGSVQNYPARCTWELTFDGRQGETYVFHHSRTLVGGCPAIGTSYYTLQPDGSLLRVHINPTFTVEGILKQRPDANN